MVFQIIETLLDYAAIEKLSKEREKTKIKQKQNKTKKPKVNAKIFFTKILIRGRPDEEKTTLYNKFKIYQGTITNLTKISKGNHYQKYFMNIKRLCLKLEMGSSLLQTWQKREKRHKLAFVTQIHSINSIKYRSNKI